MRNFNKKVIILYVLLLSYILITSIFTKQISSIYNFYLNPIFWISLATLSYILFKDKNLRYKGASDKIQIVFIVMLVYVLIYFLSGVLFDFAKNIYSTKLINILKNLWMFASIIIFKEIVREKLIVHSGKRISYLILITMLMIVIDIEIMNINYYFNSSELFFKYFFSTIFPIITSNILCTYLVIVGGFKTSLTFRMPLILIKLLIPIQPDLDWFFTAIYEGLLPIVIYLFVSKYHLNRTSKESRRIIKKSTPRFRFILVGFLIIFCFFIAGIFSYKPIAVMSGSMEPIFYRGDLVIVEKIKNDNDCQKLKLYDIIEYRLDKRVVLHRIIKIENKEGKLIFTTKGDNNELPDELPVETSQVVGKIKFTVKYAGYPSVLLNEYFQK